jgi:cation transport regulator ChaC
MWIFGYGSLIWKVDFPFIERRPVFIRNFVRRFWQLSTDHRGTPEMPGLVATLVPIREWQENYAHLDPHQASDVWGMAYKIADESIEDVKRHLDYREKDGYSTIHTKIFHPDGPFSEDGELQPLIEDDVLVYLGTSQNPNFTGPKPLHELVEIISTRCGPSGTNRECKYYVLFK